MDMSGYHPDIIPTSPTQIFVARILWGEGGNDSRNRNWIFEDIYDDIVYNTCVLKPERTFAPPMWHSECVAPNIKYIQTRQGSHE